jgi:tRNA-dihydrouridine synthase C
MEGVTDPVFRDLVIAQGGVGGASTEFLRISASALPAKVLRRHLGEPQDACPVGVQLMAPDTDHVAETVAAAERAGAAFLDLNFGCPAKVVFQKCAGSALLADPPLLGRIVAAAVGATSLPVTAKMRAGVDSPARMEDCLAAAAEAGAAAVCLHARLRTTSYEAPARWEWIAAAKAALRGLERRLLRPIPLVGNGGADGPGDLARMRSETGCDGVMVGRGAIADPWVFARALGRPAASAAEAAAFALEYGAAVEGRHGARAALMKLKQLLRYYRAGGLLEGPTGAAARRALLRAGSLEEVRAWLRAHAASGAPGDAPLPSAPDEAPPRPLDAREALPCST